MNYARTSDSNTLSLEIDKMPLVYQPQFGNIVVRHEFGKVILFVGNKRIELDTTTAHGIGYNIFMAELSSGELFVIKINRERIELLDDVAKKVAAALLRKADDADDWQIRSRK